tara:strand:- start:9851 stop:10375 length:525 start_codon:yes stop_codon:yes gene_type:complete
MHTGIQVGHAMTKNPVIVTKDTNIENCAKEMIEHKIGSVLIIEYKKLLGIVTEKDVMEKVVSKGVIPNTITAEEVMSKKIITTTPEEDIYKAILTMRNTSVRRLPVLNNDQVIGLLTLKDVLRVHPDLFEIVVEKLRIREENSKLGQIEANCPSCGALSILYRSRGQFLCDSCK